MFTSLIREKIDKKSVYKQLQLYEKIPFTEKGTYN